jgi:hypothetical protein
LATARGPSGRARRTSDVPPETLRGSYLAPPTADTVTKPRHEPLPSGSLLLIHPRAELNHFWCRPAPPARPRPGNMHYTEDHRLRPTQHAHGASVASYRLGSFLRCPTVKATAFPVIRRGRYTPRGAQNLPEGHKTCLKVNPPHQPPTNPPQNKAHRAPRGPNQPRHRLPRARKPPNNHLHHPPECYTAPGRRGPKK